MTSLRGWFDEFTAETGEVPTHIVLADTRRYYDADGLWPEVEPNQVVLFGDLPDSLLDREFHDGFGGNDSPDLCAWSASRVIFSDNYDGAERLCSVPRMPEAHEPIRPGGG